MGAMVGEMEKGTRRVGSEDEDASSKVKPGGA